MRGTAALGDNSLLVCHFELPLSHNTVTVNINISTNAALTMLLGALNYHCAW